jgi:hypothetical protein
MADVKNASLQEPMIDKQISLRAYRYWEERGRPHGLSEVDWYRAVEDLRQERNLQAALALSCEKNSQV